MLLAIALTSLLALPPQDPGPQDPPDQTCREAYVEGWFQETAEADLEAALRAYGRCVTLGTPADRELVARAYWRIGMIARAREEQTVAREMLERVLREFEGTKAAERALEALAAPVQATASESEAIRQAREDLRDALLTDDRSQVSRKRLASAFRTLSAEQIVEVAERENQSLANLLKYFGSAVADDHTEKLVELAFVGDPETGRMAIRALPYGGPLPERLLTLVEGESAELDSQLFWYLLNRQEDEAMAALLEVVERNPELIDWQESRGALTTLLTNPHPTAGEVTRRMLSTVPRTPEGLDALGNSVTGIGKRGTKPTIPLLQTTPAGWEVLAVFPELPAKWRDELAGQVLKRDMPQQVINVLLADPEPAVRRAGLIALLYSPEPAMRSEALQRVKREPIAEQPAVLRAACNKTDPAFPLEELLAVAEGTMRELVYLEAVSLRSPDFDRQGRGIADVLRIGLDRGDPELLRAVFARSDVLRRIDPSRPSPLPGVQLALQRTVPGGGQENLAERLTIAALGAADESVQLQVPTFAQQLLAPEVLARCLEPALRSPSAAVRRAALRLSPVEISTETMVRLLHDPNHLIFATALDRANPSPEALLASLEGLSAERQLRVLRHAKKNDYLEVVRALYKGASQPSSREIAIETFNTLKTRDAEILIDGLLHRSGVIRGSAAQKLNDLQIGEWEGYLWLGAGVTGPGVEEERQRAASNLRARVQEVATALQLWNVAWLTERVRTNSNDEAAKAELAGELVAMGDRKRLVEYALRGGWTDVGGRGLVLLGDREAMRTALLESYQPAALVLYALELGLVDTCIELVRSGRLRTIDLVVSLSQEGRYDDLADLLLREDAPFLERSRLDPRTITLIVDAAAGREDPALLSRAAERFDAAAAVNALFQREELDVILTDLPRWGDQARYAALSEISRRTGGTVDWADHWTEYATEQQALLATLRDKLGVGGDDER